MGSTLPAFAPIGRLFDPLADLAERIRADAMREEITVWTDQAGAVYAMSAATLAGIPIDTAVGSYTSASPATAIERDLLDALQNRSRRIFDWDEDGDESAWQTRQPIRKRHHAYS